MAKCFLALKPKVLPTSLQAFIRGIGGRCISSVGNALESWVDFEFQKCLFQAHRDGDEWHFFTEGDCPPGCIEELSRRLRAATAPGRGWWVVVRGLLRRALGHP